MKETSASKLPPDLAAWHFLSRTTFGPGPQDVERARQTGIKAILEEQLHPETIDDSEVEQKIASLPTLTMSPAELMEDFPAPMKGKNPEAKPQTLEQQGYKPFGPNPATPQNSPPMGAAMEPDGPRRIMLELAREQFWRAAYSRRQLQEVMVQFWMNHFNIYAGKGVDKWLITSYEQDTIRPNALGNFDQLLTATAQSPAMLFYLDNWLSVGPNSPEGRHPGKNRHGLNENYAREIMELHTLGVDGGYTQEDVREVACCFTGWTIDRPQKGGGFTFRPRTHDDGKKVVLGHKIGGRGGMEDGMEVLRRLAAHPSTARFISLKLCRHFVADDPPAAVVSRAAETFTQSRGNLRHVLKTILTSPEFNSQAAFRAKVKSPFELVASSLRTLEAETDGGAPLMGQIQRMGQPLFQYQAPTGYPDRGSSWINSGTLLARMNFSMALAANKIPGTRLDFQALAPSGDSPEVWDQLVQRTLGGSVTDETRAAVMKSLDGLGSQGGGKGFPKTMLMAALLLGSPDFQRR